MEFTDMLNGFFGSPVFSIITIVGIVIIGAIIRFVLLPTSSEYKHRPDRE
jgi:hypothetical protein